MQFYSWTNRMKTLQPKFQPKKRMKRSKRSSVTKLKQSRSLTLLVNDGQARATNQCFPDGQIPFRRTRGSLSMLQLIEWIYSGMENSKKATKLASDILSFRFPEA